MMKSFYKAVISCFFLTLSLAGYSSAAIYEWDTSTTAGYQPGDGIWASTGGDTKWTTNGGASLIPWANANSVQFSAISGPSVITLNDVVTADNLKIAGNQYTVVITPGAGVSMIDAGNQSIRIGFHNGSTNTLLIDGNGAEGGAVITNGGSLIFGHGTTGGSIGSVSNRVVVTNGGALYIKGGFIGYSVRNGNTYHSYGNHLIVANGGRLISTGHVYVAYDENASSTMVRNQLLVTGTNAVMNMNGSGIYISEGYAGSGVNSNSFVIDGGLVTNVGAMQICLTTYNSIHQFNRLVITNGGRLYSSQASSIANLVNCSNNRADVAGTNSVWLLGGANLSIGAAGATNNQLAIHQAGYVGNIGTLTVPGSNMINLAGGTLAASNITYNTNQIFIVGDGGQPAALRLLGGAGIFPKGLLVNSNGALHGSGRITGGAAGVVITNRGMIAPGWAMPVALTNGGSCTLSPGAIARFTIASNSMPGIGWDLFAVTNGTLTLGGTVVIDLANGFMPQTTNVFMVMTNTSPMSGAFDMPSARATAYRKGTDRPYGSFKVWTNTTCVFVSEFRLANGAVLYVK